MRFFALLIGIFALTLTLMAATEARTDDNFYVGSAACGECHEDEYSNFAKYAKKAHSADSVKKMAPKLTKKEIEECYTCHMTGYGKPGGFVSFEETPELADCGCEVCHGPGGKHVDEGGDIEYIANPSLEECTVCHNSERVSAFDFKPLLHGGAH